jgi:hypothetical protein
MTPAQLDDILSRYDREWGPCRLPTLVSEATKAKYEAVRAALDVGMASWAPDEAAIRATMAKAFAAMEKEALEAGHRPLPPACFEGEWAPGRRFAVCWGPMEKQALALRYRASGEDVSLWDERDIAELIARLPLAAEIMHAFKGAAVHPTTYRDGKRKAGPGDDLSDILPLPGEDAA